jgi:opacity protein-like surface antigen
MKKFLFLSAAVLCVASTASAHNWYAGVGLGWKEGKFKGELSTRNLAGLNPPTYTAKSSFSKGTTLGSVFGGHKFTFNACDVFVQINASKDFGKAGKKSVTTSTANLSSADISIQRLGAVGVDVGISKTFKIVDAYVKVGVVGAQFEFKMTDTTANHTFSTKASRYGIGFAPGFGLEKNLGSVSVGFGYEYQLYNKVQYNSDDGSTGNATSVFASPRYHVFALSIKKTF